MRQVYLRAPRKGRSIKCGYRQRMLSPSGPKAFFFFLFFFFGYSCSVKDGCRRKHGRIDREISRISGILHTHTRMNTMYLQINLLIVFSTERNGRRSKSAPFSAIFWQFLAKYTRTLRMKSSSHEYLDLHLRRFRSPIESEERGREAHT